MEFIMCFISDLELYIIYCIYILESEYLFHEDFDYKLQVLLIWRS